VNGIDLLIIAGLILAAVAGFRRGALLQIVSYGGLFIGLAVGAVVAPPLAGLAESPTAQAAIALASLLLCAGIGNAVGWAAGSAVRSRAHRTRLKGVDHAGGIVVSLVASLLAIWFVSINLVNGPFPGLAKEVRSSAIVRALGDAMPKPPWVLAEVRRFLDRVGFPEVFAGLPPAPAGPVRWPSAEQARSAFDAAAGSTVRVVGGACGQIQLGSGFVADEHHVVTAAHVLAGVASPEVQEQGGGSEPARTVLFDPRMDIAVLYVDSALPPPLALATDVLQRGDGGVILGYPNGGGLVGGRAAVRRPIPAVGRDIYGRHEVEREVYELQATVHPGNSGGPFVLPDGAVAGMVFAASTVDEGLGYAIASTAMLPDLQRASRATQPVPTGACLP
jgi:S1-C subfamily serine protease